MADDTTRIINLTEATEVSDGMYLVTDASTGTRKLSLQKVLDKAGGNVADDYDATATYDVGDLCVYKGVLYECSTEISTAEAWNPNHWTQTNIDGVLFDLESRVEAIENEEGLHRYGVSGIGQSAATLTRMWDSVGMTAQVGTDGDNSNVVNDFDYAAPFQTRKCVGDWHVADGRAVFAVHAYEGDEDYTEDGTKGKFVAVEYPRSYFCFKNGTLGISTHQYEGWEPFDIFCHKHNPNETMSHYYHPAYSLAVDENGDAVSLPGYDNAQGNYKELLDKARTYNDGIMGNLAILEPMAFNFYEWALFTVEFATQNCQAIMQGCSTLRHSNDDHVVFKDESHLLTNNYYAARVVGEYIAVIELTVDINSSTYLATHKITEIVRCNESGVADPSGTHQLLTVTDLGKDYYEYDTTGATEYRLAARPYRTGECKNVSTPSGSPVSNANGYYPCKYRHHENPFGNQFKTAVDFFAERVGTGDDDYSLDWYYLPDPTVYEPSTTSKPDSTDLQTDAFEKLDIKTLHANYVSGYIKSKKYSEEYPQIWIPFETSGGGSGTYFCDYAYLVTSDVVRSVRLCGAWAAGSAAGFSYVTAHHGPGPSSAAYGGDLCFAQ